MQINSATTAAYTSADTPLPRRAAPADDTTDVEQDASADDAAVPQQTNPPSSVKSFAYGALGLERPEVQATDTNGFYTAGKWVAAAATIGGIVSLFV
ncbi:MULTISPECIES: hypothetical protein [unclassified Caballeronia]|uniref:hypothetical protein n=1 Tax=unclassified Caballeronia TaxID=2646786 RepID=UPI002028529D|nr:MULTISPECIES: hypothetical protein [unclassified Caballeronia]MDR5766868.1 hypothetical protein [Caballeronia sp. LZ028]